MSSQASDTGSSAVASPLGDRGSSSQPPPLQQTMPDASWGDERKHGGSAPSGRDYGQSSSSTGSGVDTPAANSSERKRLFRSPCPSNASGSASQSSPMIQRKDISGCLDTRTSNGDDVTDEEPMLSILNVVVDHVMVPPTPMEPEEFDVFCRQRREQLKKQEAEERREKLNEDKFKIDLTPADEAEGHASGTNTMDVDEEPMLFPLSQQSVRSDLSTPGASASALQSQSFLEQTPTLPNEKVLVPVLRFFGPVIRGDPATVRSTPRQSGCLHVHGAFPYLVARPVTAGPDGSSYRRPGDCSRASVSSRIDWDDAESVSYIVDEIHAKLEAALRATDEWKEKRDTMDGGGVNNAAANAGGDNGDGFAGTIDSPKVPIRYIRQVTVVKGKGFYTYCSGPPAPFLRVEYYDPKSKWKVKLMLEKGLDVDEAYHPDARFYDYGGDDSENVAKNDVGDNDHDGEDEVYGGRGMRQSSPPLKFRCYEAHIPFTMQVFKDLNLSGMYYIKVKKGMFRRSLPKKERKRVPNSSVDESGNERLFLEENVPERFQWDSPQSLRIETKSGDTTDATLNADAGDSFLNDTSMPNTPNRQQQTTGSFVGELSQPEPSITDVNATPSHPNPTPTAEGIGCDDTKYCPYSFVGLRPEDQFWTTKESLCDVELDASCTDLMNVQDVMTSLPDDPTERARVHWRAVPSLREIWELERRRMATLLSKEDDFLNSAPDDEGQREIPDPLPVDGSPSVPGARLALRGNKRLYDPSPGLEEDYRRALSDIAKRHLNFVQRVNSAFKGDGPAVFSPKTQSASLGLSTPSSSQDEALAALNALGEQFGGDFEQMNLRSQEVAHASQLSSLSPQTPNSRIHAGSLRGSPLSQVAPLTQADIEDIQEATAFGHSLERGESVLGDLTAGSSSVDPFTLTPNENEYDSEEDVFHEEEKLGEEGFARSLSMLATQQPSTESDEPMGKGDSQRIDGKSNGHQILGASINGVSEGEFEGSPKSFLLSQADQAIETIHEEDSHSFSSDDDEGRYHASNEDDVGVDHSDATAIDNDCTLYQDSQEKYSAEMSSESERKDEAISTRTQCTVLRRGEYLLPRESLFLPRRKDCDAKKAKGWHAVHKTGGRSQPWLRLSSAFEIESGGQEILLATLFCSNRKANVFVEPVRRPPSSRQVRAWLKKTERRKKDSLQIATTNGIAAKKRKRTDLVIDDNTRKLVPASAPNTSQKRRRVAFANDVVHHSSCQVFQVEEIQVDESDCKSQMSQSPYQSQSSLLSLSQEDEGNEEYSQLSSLRKDGASSNVQSPMASIGSQTSADSRQTQGSSSARAYSAFDPSCTMGHGEGMSPLSAADALEGIGQQGGKIHVAGGGGLKGEAGISSTNHLPSAPTPLTIISVEIHVQCRTGKAGAHDSKTIAMRPDPSRDKVVACVYLYARDPGGGEAIEILERGVLFTPVEAEIVGRGREDVNRFVRKSLGISIDRAKVEMLQSERQLLLRLASIVKYKDPDALMSWDTQGGGLGYLIERGVALAKGPTVNGDANENTAPKRGKEIDMVKLLGRIIKKPTTSSASLDSHEQQEGIENGTNNEWGGSGLGSDWDERVGAGAAAASIVSFCLAFHLNVFIHHSYFLLCVVLAHTSLSEYVSWVWILFSSFIGRTIGHMWVENDCRRSKASQFIISTRYGSNNSQQEDTSSRRPHSYPMV